MFHEYGQIRVLAWKIHESPILPPLFLLIINYPDRSTIISHVLRLLSFTTINKGYIQYLRDNNLIRFAKKCEV